LLINLCLKINAAGNPGCTLFNSECTISAGNTLRLGPGPECTSSVTAREQTRTNVVVKIDRNSVRYFQRLSAQSSGRKISSPLPRALRQKSSSKVVGLGLLTTCKRDSYVRFVGSWGLNINKINKVSRAREKRTLVVGHPCHLCC